MKRLLVVLAVVVAAAAVALAVLEGPVANAGTGTSHSSSTITFTLERVGGFFPHGQPQPGTSYGSVQTVTGDDGSTGTGDVLCTFVTEQARFCDVQLTMSKGLLSLQGIAYEPNVNEPFTVTGGTGAYAVGRGSAIVNDVNETTVRFTVKLPA